MKNVVLKYGLLAGLIQTVVGFGLMFLLNRDGSSNLGYTELLGYSTMIVALSLIFFGIKAYRDQHEDGFISFKKAVKIGVLITLVASGLYVVGWLIYYHFGSGQAMMDAYVVQTIEAVRNSGKNAEHINQEIEKIESFSQMYQNPIVMIGITFMEIFPVGLLISLIAALLLKKSPEVAVSNGKTANT